MFVGRGEMVVQDREDGLSPNTRLEPGLAGASALAGRERGERLDGANLRNAKNLKDAVIAIAIPTPRRSLAGPAPPRLT